MNQTKDFKECYEILNTKKYGEEYDYEKLFIDTLGNFLEIYQLENIKEENFEKFKYDTYFMFSYILKMFFEYQEPDDDELNEKEKEKYLEIKKNTEYIVNNIETLEFHTNYSKHPIITSLNVIIAFFREINENMEAINKMMEDTCVKMENFSNTMEINLKLSEITDYIKENVMEKEKLQEYDLYLSNVLAKYTNEDIQKVCEIERDTEYRKTIYNNDNIDKSEECEYLMIQSILTLKMIIKNKNKLLENKLF